MLAVEDLTASLKIYATALRLAAIDERTLTATFELHDPALTVHLVEDPERSHQIVHLGFDTRSGWLNLCRVFDGVGLACDCHEDWSSKIPQARAWTRSNRSGTRSSNESNSSSTNSL